MLVNSTLEISGSRSGVVGVAAIYVFWWIAISVTQTSCCISLDLFAVAQFFDGFGSIQYCCHHFICMCYGGSRNFPVAKIYFICELLVAGGFYVAPMRTIVFRRCP